MAPIGSEERPHPREYADHYHTYVTRVPPGPVLQHLQSRHLELLSMLSSIPAEKADHAYAPGKWTVKQVMGHLSDVERIMTYRALRFARNDRTGLPSFDENFYVVEGGFTARTLPDLLDEFRAVREASIAFFAHLPPEHFSRGGEASGHYVSVRALLYIIVGHELHHRAILQERYL